MEHNEFVAAYHDGRIRVDIDRKGAARFVSRRLLLPLVMMPILGIGTALAIIGWIWTGLAIIAVGNLLPRTRPNIAFGLRTDRTLSNPQLWQQVHRVGGYAAVGLGVVILLMGITAANQNLAGAMVLPGAAVAVAIVYLSYRRYANA